MKGIDIVYVSRILTGKNQRDEPIYEESYETVSDVLVAPVIQDPIPEEGDIRKKKKQKLLAIPKGDAHNWEDCKVIIDGEVYESVGYPEEGIEALVPTRWHKKVTVQRYD